MGYAQPAVFGTAKLAGSSSDDASISTALVTGIKNYTYTGKAIKQDLNVEVNGKQLSKDKDYTVSYKNNVNAGTAEVYNYWQRKVIQVQYQRHLKLQKLNRRYRLRNLIIRKLLEAKVLN